MRRCERCGGSMEGSPWLSLCASCVDWHRCGGPQRAETRRAAIAECVAALEALAARWRGTYQGDGVLEAIEIVKGRLDQ